MDTLAGISLGVSTVGCIGSVFGRKWEAAMWAFCTAVWCCNYLMKG